MSCRYIREQMLTSSNGDRRNVPNYLVVLTDGRSDNKDSTWREAQLARQAGIHIIAGRRCLIIDTVRLKVFFY